MRQVKIGLLGCGTVGKGFVHLLERNRDLIRARARVDVCGEPEAAAVKRKLEKVQYKVR